MTVRNSRLTVVSAWCAAVALGMMFAAHVGWAATPCQGFDPECMTNGVCQADGTCQGTPEPEGKECHSFNPCTLTAQCQAGECVTQTNKTDGTACTLGVGLCIKNSVCQTFFNITFCYPPVDTDFVLIDPTDVVDCAALGNKCMGCNPQTGACTVPRVAGDCATGQCDPATGDFQPKTDGTACSDFNECTSNDQCQGGICNGGGVVGTTTPGPNPTPTTPPLSGCTGDCNHDNQVTVDEVLTISNIALGNDTVSTCTAGDPSGNGRIAVDNILAAVNNARNGCSVLPTPTPTPTTPAGPATPTRTATAGAQTSPGPGSAVSGQTTVALSAVTVIGDVVAAIANGYTLGGGASAASSTELLMTPADPGLGGAAGACPLGGSATRTGSVFTGYTVAFQNGCAVSTVDGKVAFGGGAFASTSALNANITATFSDLSGNTLYEEAAANVTGTVNGFPSLGGSCFLTAISLKLTGTLSTTMMPPGGPHVSVVFTNTTLNVSNITFTPACVPTAYDLTLNGPGTLLAPDGSQVNVTFSNLTLHITSNATGTTLTVTGGMNSPCFGGTGTATLATLTPLTVPTHESCPNDGIMTATLPLPQGTTTISFGPGGSVHVQSSTENVNAPNCLDPRLLMCLA